MDPDAALESARQALAAYHAAEETDDLVQASLKLAEAFEALDGWLTKQGFPPKAWKPATTQVLITLDDRTQVGLVDEGEYHVRDRPSDSWSTPLKVATDPHLPGTVFFGPWR